MENSKDDKKVRGKSIFSGHKDQNITHIEFYTGCKHFGGIVKITINPDTTECEQCLKEFKEPKEVFAQPGIVHNAEWLPQDLNFSEKDIEAINKKLRGDQSQALVVPTPTMKRDVLKIGDVVEFTHNGAHEKTIGFVFENMAGGNYIQCRDYITGIGDRKYRVLYNLFESVEILNLFLPPKKGDIFFNPQEEDGAYYRYINIKYPHFEYENVLENRAIIQQTP